MDEAADGSGSARPNEEYDVGAGVGIDGLGDHLPGLVAKARGLKPRDGRRRVSVPVKRKHILGDVPLYKTQSAA